MATTKLTKTVIDTIRLPPSATRIIVRDSLAAGLELTIGKRTKVWSFRYRGPLGQRRVTLGKFPGMGVPDARAAARKEQHLLDQRHDPQQVRTEAAAAAQQAAQDSIDLLIDRYLEHHAKPSKRSWRADAGLLKREVLPVWRGRPASSITPREVHQLVQAIAARPAPIYANRTLAVVRRMFRFACQEFTLATNPAREVRPPGREAAARQATSKAYTDEELQIIWQNLEGQPLPVAGAIKVQLYTGARPGEILNLQWVELHDDWLVIPAARSKNGREQRIYLVPEVRALLGEVPRLDDEPFVFAGYRGRRQVSLMNDDIFANTAPRVKPRHSLRSTVATGLGQLGLPMEIISATLHHALPGLAVTSGYMQHRYYEESQQALLAWAALLHEKLKLKKDDVAEDGQAEGPEPVRADDGAGVDVDHVAEDQAVDEDVDGKASPEPGVPAPDPGNEG